MAVIEELLEAFKAQQQTIETLTVKLEETTAELEKAKARIAELEEQLHKDSHNSSKPPSTDGYEKPSPKSQRQKSGKKAGGQTGHKGHHMELGNVDRVEQIYPKHCANCLHRENCTNLKVHNSCYVVDMEIKTTALLETPYLRYFQLFCQALSPDGHSALQACNTMPTLCIDSSDFPNTPAHVLQSDPWLA